MIRSSRTTLRFANGGKREALSSLCVEYRRVVQEFIDLLWVMPYGEVRALVPKEVVALLGPTDLSARLVQCAGKQASAIVRGTRKKNEQRKWRHARLVEEGKAKEAGRLLAVIAENDGASPIAPEDLPMELDERFCRIELEGSSSFDGWLVLGSLGKKMKLKLPFRRSKHFNAMFEKGAMKKGVRLSDKRATFMFELPDKEKKAAGATAGIDIGMTTLLSCSSGWSSEPCIHGHDMASISQKLARRKKGSKGFRKAQQHRKNYIGQQMNRLPWEELKAVQIEKIRGLRKGRRTSRFLGHFNYADILGRIRSIAEEQGVLVREMDPAFTSRRCSACGWTRESNRKGKRFVCGSCGYAADADMNASCNLALDLPVLERTGRKRPDDAGFHWPALDRGEEPMSPSCSETEKLCVGKKR